MGWSGQNIWGVAGSKARGSFHIWDQSVKFVSRLKEERAEEINLLAEQNPAVNSSRSETIWACSHPRNKSLWKDCVPELHVC